MDGVRAPPYCLLVRMPSLPRIAFSPEAFLQQQFGGVSRCFAELARALDAAGELEVSVHATVHGNAHLLELPTRLVRGSYLPITGDLRKVAIGLPRSVFEASVAARPPALAHDTGYAFCAKKPRGFPVVITVHDMIQESDPGFARAKERALREKRAAIDRATHIVVPSESTRSELMRIAGVDPARISVVHHGARLPEPAPAHPLGGTPYILHVGARRRYKDFATLLRAFATLQRGGFAGVLVTVTRTAFAAEERALLRTLGLREGSVCGVPADDRALATLYAHALALAVPSRAEGFGIPILEAMSLGCPVACMRVLGSEEVAGGAALLADAGDDGGLARNLAECLADSPVRARCIALGRARAEELSWSRAAARYAEVARTLLHEHAPVLAAR